MPEWGFNRHSDLARFNPEICWVMFYCITGWVR